MQKREGVGILLIVLLVFSIAFVLADHLITNTSGGTTYSINEDTSSLINVTINNTDTDLYNITQVNISLENSNFSFVLGTNGTSVSVSNFTNSSSTVLNWSNITNGMVFNGTKQSFWFNITVSHPGVYNLSITVWNSTVNASKNTNLTITVNDTTKPVITILFPSNTSYNLSATLGDLNYSVFDNNASSKCWYSNNTGVTNSSVVAAGTNWTSMKVKAGLNNWTVFCNDSAGNVNSSTIYFTNDTILPVITILSPTNTSYDSSIQLNYSVTDTYSSASKCWYSNNTGITNQSDVAAGTNWTTIITFEGLNNLTVFCNDTAGNVNSTIIYFTNATRPLISILYPTNTSYNQSLGDLNYSVVDANPSKCWYSNNTGITNQSAVNSGTNWTSVVSAQGLNNWTVFCNDTLGNVNSTTVYFTNDTSLPVITILYPINSSYNQSIGNLNYSIVDYNPSRCWWSNNTGITNSSDVAYGTNFTGLLSLTGINNWTVFCNDTFGKVNSTIVYFTNDSTKPRVYLRAPTDSQATEDTGINFSFNVSDISSIPYCLLIYDGSVINNLTTIINSSTMGMYNSSLAVGSHTWSVNCSDSAGNINNSETWTLIIRSGGTPGSDSSGSTGGGSGGDEVVSEWTLTSDIASSLLGAGYVKQLGVNQRIRFNLSGEEHYIGVKSINGSRALIAVASYPQQKELVTGEEWKVEITGDNKYDLSIVLGSILNNKAILTVNSIQEEIPEEELEQIIEQREETAAPEEITEQSNKSLLIGIGIAVAVIILLILFFLLIRKK